MEKCPHCPVRDLGRECKAQRTGHLRFCQLADPDDPAYSPAMVARLRGEAPSFPPLVTQAANLAAAVGRFVASGGEMTTAEERGRRIAICQSNECGQYVAGRCAACGCRLSAKIASAAEHCPLDPPRW